MLGYPVFYDQSPAEKRNRLTLFFRIFMIIPHYFVLIFYGFAAVLCMIGAWFALVITGQYPQSLYDFNAGFLRFFMRTVAYITCLTDEFPPFDGGEHPEYPVQVIVAPRQASYSRARALFRYFMLIPVNIINYAMGLWIFFMAIVFWFAGVVLGKTSASLLDAIRLPMAYYTRSQAFTLLLTEGFPPFEPGTRPELTPPPVSTGLA